VLLKAPLTRHAAHVGLSHKGRGEKTRGHERLLIIDVKALKIIFLPTLFKIKLNKYKEFASPLVGEARDA